jgi:hypothetical protein
VTEPAADTSHTATPPPKPSDPQIKSIFDLSDSEYKALRKQITGRDAPTYLGFNKK